MDGIKFEQGMRQTATRSRCGDAGDCAAL